jgi:hypothetical protein
VTTKPPEDDGLFDRLDAGEPPLSPEEAEARAPYERLLGRIRDLEDPAPPPGWEDRAVARWQAARRRRRVVIAVAGASAAFAAALVLQCVALTPRGFNVTVVAAGGMERADRRRAPGDADGFVGDTLHASVPIYRPHTELRVYRAGKLVMLPCAASKTRQPPCGGDDSRLTLDWRVPDDGVYEVVWLSSASEIPASQGFDDGLSEARRLGIAWESRTKRFSL